MLNIMICPARIDTSPNSSNQKIKALEKVKIDAFVPSQQTISLILNSEGTGFHCIDQKALLMSDKKELSPDWVTGLERGTVTCEDVTTIKLSILLSEDTGDQKAPVMSDMKQQLPESRLGLGRGPPPSRLAGPQVSRSWKKDRAAEQGVQVFTHTRQLRPAMKQTTRTKSGQHTARSF